MAEGFEVVCEIEPAVRPDLKRVRHQIGVLSSVASVAARLEAALAR
jgi:methylenetetrahydrofolate reductase (NADPH)